jgi:hypothetical protein
MNSWIQNYKFPIVILPTCLLAFLLIGCTYTKEGFRNDDLLNWKYSELRIMDPHDVIEPDQDIVAVYTRLLNQSFQIRIDFLALDWTSASDVYIALDTNPGGNPGIKAGRNGYIPSNLDWDYLIKVSTSMKFNILNAQYKPSTGMETFVVLDPAQDRMVISLPKDYLPIYLGRTNIQVFITPENTGNISDKSDPVAIDASPPPRAKVLFIFWNTFSAASPAETLRSWAGAHSGPMSSRHGLQYLLDAADRTNTTIFLMNTLTPDTLSALDLLKAIPKIRTMMNREVLVFYDLIDVERADLEYRDKLYEVWFGSEESKNFELSYLIGNNCVRNICIYNKGGNDYTQLNEITSYFNSYILDNISDYTPSSISLECKSMLLKYAYTQPATPILLGGDFSKSLLGSPSVNKALFSYIQAHPWIQVLSAKDFLTNDYQTVVNTTLYRQNQEYRDNYEQSVSSVQEEISRTLNLTPSNQISALAYRAFARITQPVLPDLLSLSPNYIGQVGEIIQAAQWAAQPSTIETCEVDPDYDGSNECILANNNIFMVIDPEGGYIPFVFSNDYQGVHQIIGPTWEFMLGISDISTWNPDLGVRADAKQILGAFQDKFSDWNSYTPYIKEHIVELLCDNTNNRKLISLSSNSIHVETWNSDQIYGLIYIPLVVDPWLRYLPGWGDFYIADSSPTSYLWGINDGVMVKVDANAPYLAFSYKDSQSLLLQPEDPNFNYPPGHYLPYPMSLVEINPSASISIDIDLK